MKILLAVDGSKSALRATRNLVETLAQYKQTPEVELVTVRQPLPHIGPFGSVVIGQDTIESYHREEGEKALAPSKQVLEAAGIRYSPHVLVGEIAQTIIAHAQKSGCEMIYIGTRGMTPISSALLGSIAMKVLYLTPVPVVLVP